MKGLALVVLYKKHSETPSSDNFITAVRLVLSGMYRKDASWSPNWPSGANLLAAHKQHKYIWLLGEC